MRSQNGCVRHSRGHQLDRALVPARRIAESDGNRHEVQQPPRAGSGEMKKTRAPKREKVHLAFEVNGERQEVAFAPHKTLLEILREDLRLTGTKHGCELGECGTCTVLLDGQPELSCLVLGLECEGRKIVTVEGIQEGPSPHPLQQAFAELGAAQCGYCTPGILCAAKACWSGC